MRQRWIPLLAGTLIAAALTGCVSPGSGAATAGMAAQTPAGAGDTDVPTPAATRSATRTFTVLSTPGMVASPEELVALNATPVDPSTDAGLEKLVAQAREDLSRRLGVGGDQIDLVEMFAVVWPDGSFGCPRPGIEYVQVPRDGFLIRLRAGGRVYGYHGGGGRSPFLCDATPTIMRQEDEATPPEPGLR